MLFVVRHAAPEVVPEVPPSRWPLSAAGRAGAAAAARRLAPAVGADAVLVSSPEPKAAQTISALAAVLAVDRGGRREPAAVDLDERLGEVARPAEPRDGTWRAARIRYVEGEDLPGWEPRRDVAGRFDAAVRDHLALADRAALVVGSHGMVMTCWLVDRGLLETQEAASFWSALALPDAFAVDLAAGRVTRVP